MKIRILLLLSILLASRVVLSQNDQDRYFEMEEDSLNILFSEIQITNSNLDKFEINKKIIDLLEYVLYDEMSFKNPLDSVNNLGIITSDDNLLRIYTWNLQMSDMTFKYFGFIQYYNEKFNEYSVYELIDKSDEIDKPEKLIVNNENWYGALYYRIIETSDDKYKYYTLLGWDGNNEWTTKRIIDVLYFSNSGKPRFGANIFYIVRQGDERRRVVRQKRILFEYSSLVNMTVIYDDKMKMIVFDHLSPDDSSNADEMRFYGPDWKYCGLKFKKGKWNYYDDIDPRNPKPKDKPVKWRYKKTEDLFK